MKQNLLFNQLTAMPKRLAMVLTVLFTLGVGSIFGEEYKLVTSTNDLVAGEKYLIGTGISDDVNFISTELKANNRNLASGIVSSQKVTKTDQMMAFTLGGSTGSWTFKTNDYLGTAGYLNATNTTSSNYLKVVATLDEYAYFSISIASNVATITCTGKNSRHIVRYNSSNSPKIISCYTSGYNDVYLYKQVASCDKKVTITKASATGGSFKVHQGTASGTEISSGGKIDNCDANAVVVVVPTANANYTCTGVTATNSTSISGPDGNGNYTITYTKGSNISSEISVTFTENQTHTVTWIVNGNEYTEGTPTASVYEGAKWSSLTLPTAPSPNDYCGQVFAGWTTTNIGSTGLDKDNDATAIQNLNLMTSENKSSKTNTITDNIIFYAVFADYAD